MIRTTPPCGSALAPVSRAEPFADEPRYGHERVGTAEKGLYAIAADGSLWVLDSANIAYRYLSPGSHQAEPSQPPTSISCGGLGNFWGVDVAGFVYKLAATPLTPAPFSDPWHITVRGEAGRGSPSGGSQYMIMSAFVPGWFQVTPPPGE